MSEPGLPSAGWIFYDGDCGFCSRWVSIWSGVLARRGFALEPLQGELARQRLGLEEGELLRDLWLLPTEGEALRGADAYRHVLARIWWAWPFYGLSITPGFRWVFERAYRRFADHRHRFSKACGLSAEPPSGHGKDS